MSKRKRKQPEEYPRIPPSYSVMMVRDAANPPGKVCTMDMASGILTVLMGHLPHEEMHMLLVDSCSKIVGSVRVSQGGAAVASITPEDVLRPAVTHCARGVVLGHNHPSGDTTPSRADLALTRQIKQALELVSIPLLDHIIVCHEQAESYSMFVGGDLDELFNTNSDNT